MYVPNVRYIKLPDFSDRTIKLMYEKAHCLLGWLVGPSPNNNGSASVCKTWINYEHKVMVF